MKSSLLIILALAGNAFAAVNYVNTFDEEVPLSGTGVGMGLSGPGAWYVDRYAPAAFERADFNGGSVLKISVSPADFNPPHTPPGHHNTQGRHFGLTGAGIGSSVSAQLYVSSSWQSMSVSTGLWLAAVDENGDGTEFPILGFYSNGTDSYFRIYDGIDGYQTMSDTILWDDWNTLEIVLTEDGFDYFINGQAAYSSLYGEETTEFSSVILNTTNFGEAYDVYWDNLSTPSPTVPEPASFALVALGSLLTLRRKRTA
jgi:hypothetical protein